jgi:endonuclease/exonuclease/phosphatase family metal-dependent hydrolase
MTLKVMTYNIHSSIGTDGKADWQRIAELIRQESPDLLALQEVTVNHPRTPGVHVANAIAEELQMKACFGKAIPLHNGTAEYGVAALSKHPLEFVDKIYLPTPDGIEKRIFLIVKVQMEKPVFFVVTHFSYQGEFVGDEAYRTRSAQLISDTLAGKGYWPAIWAGDFNTFQGTTTMDFIHRGWDVHNDTDPETPTAKCRHAGWRQIDFICSAPKATFQCKEFKIIDDLLASDHRPVCATLQLAD